MALPPEQRENQTGRQEKSAGRNGCQMDPSCTRVSNQSGYETKSQDYHSRNDGKHDLGESGAAPAKLGNSGLHLLLDDRPIAPTRLGRLFRLRSPVRLVLGLLLLPANLKSDWLQFFFAAPGDLAEALLKV